MSASTNAVLEAAVAAVHVCEAELADAVAKRDQIISELLGQGERAMTLAIESGLTPARIYQIAKKEDQADSV